MEETAQLHPMLHMLLDIAKWFFISLAIFIPLSYALPDKKTQPLFRKDMKADTLYFFIGPFFYNPLMRFFIGFLFTLTLVQYMNLAGESNLAKLPLLVQAFLILLISDFFQYWLHRIFHRDPLWKYHAIHHSSKHVDWLSSARFHPVNIILYSTSVNAFVFCMGFRIEAFLLLIPFNAIFSPLVHANVPWTFGPFKYFLASPVFHRWHHTYPSEGGNKNFAPTFSFLDILFGTFYMPKDKRPEVFGIEGDPVPDTITGQLAYPFRKQT